MFFYVEIGVKGGGGYGGLDVWGNYKSGSDVAVGCLADRKHCFGVLVIFDCCLVMMEP